MSVALNGTASKSGRVNPHSKVRREAPSIEALLTRPGDFTAATYIRESRFLNAVDGFGMVAQDKDARHFCERMGWPNPDDLNFADGVDENASGADWDLKDLNRMLDYAEDGAFQVLVVPRNDRFARNMVKALVLEKQLLDLGVRVVFCNLPLHTQGTAEGNILKNTLHTFAEYDREKITFQTARGRRAKAELGIYVGTGPTPYGYECVRGPIPGRDGARKLRAIGLKVNEAQAAIVRQIFEWATYLPCAEIADRLNREHVPAPRRPRWCRGSVRMIVSNSVYYGVYVYGRPKGLSLNQRREPSTGIGVSVPAIIAEATWRRANEAVTDRSCKRGAMCKSDPDRFELRGLLRCGICGRALHSSTSAAYVGKTDRAKQPPPIYYFCPGHHPTEAREAGRDEVCPLGLVQAKDLHHYIWQMIESTLRDPNRVTRGLQRERETYEAQHSRREERIAIIKGELASTRQKLKRVIEDKADEERGSESWLIYVEKQREYERLIGKHERELEALSSQPSDGLSTNDAEALRVALSEVAAGLDDLRDAPPAERREFYQRLGLTGEVSPAVPGSCSDAQPAKIGRHSYILEFQARIELAPPAVCDSANNFVNFVEVGNQVQRNPFRVENGYLPVPTAPGLGVDLDEAALERFAYREFPQRHIRTPREEGP